MKKRISLSLVIQLLCAAAAVAALDQFSKYWVVSSFQAGESRPVIAGFFNLVLVYNKGAAFGMFSGMEDGLRQLLLALTTIAALALVGYFFMQEYFADLPSRLALGFIVGGAAGNIIDRVRLGQVIDFLDVFYRQHHWPAFNLADSAICIGVAVLILKSGFDGRRAKESEGVSEVRQGKV